jgi:uncharacterized protein with von Willebrand factor type A (vWA) domain
MRTVDSFEKINEIKDASQPEMDLVFVLDKSGSMYHAVEDTIGGFNSFIKREREHNPNTLVTLVLFDDVYKILYTRKPIAEVDELTDEDYFASGCTALLDAVGKTIVSLDKEISNKVMFVITTDGLENASREFSRQQVKNLISNHDWEFLFIGADIDSYAESSTLGISKNRTANYEKTRGGVNSMFNSVRMFKRSYERDEQNRGVDWKRDLE